MPASRFIVERRRPDNNPIERAGPDCILLAVLVFIDFARHQEQEQPLIKEAGMAATIARADTGNAYKPADIPLRHHADERARRRRGHGHFSERAHRGVQRTDDGIKARDGTGQRGRVPSVTVDKFRSSKLRGPGLRARSGPRRRGALPGLG